MLKALLKKQFLELGATLVMNNKKKGEKRGGDGEFWMCKFFMNGKIGVGDRQLMAVDMAVVQ